MSDSLADALRSSWRCPAHYEGNDALRCEQELNHGGQHQIGKGALAKKWGGKLQLGGKTLASRTPKPSAARAETRVCANCCEPERITMHEIRTRRGTKLAGESNLKDGRCKDRAACLARAPQLDLGFS